MESMLNIAWFFNISYAVRVGKNQGYNIYKRKECRPPNGMYKFDRKKMRPK